MQGDMKKLFLFGLLSLIFSFNVFSADKTEAERQVKERILPEIKKEEQKLIFNSYYEYSWIKQGQRKGDWKLLAETLAYRINDYITPYIETDTWHRLGEKDYTISAGSYFRFKDSPSYLRTELGWGADIDYVYKFKSTTEYGHRLFGNLYGEFGYKFLNYTDNDVYIMYPGLVYYFGDSYVTLFYNNSITESRGMAQWGTIKGDLKINDRLDFFLGTAIGERLYDINDLSDASKQYGYIWFASFDYKLTKNINLRLGGSYSMEKPSFIKRSIDFAFVFKY